MTASRSQVASAPPRNHLRPRVVRASEPPRRSFYDILSTPDERIDLGGLVVSLQISQNSWIYRKVESVAITDERRFRRQTSIDCQVPRWVVDSARARGLVNFPVPLVLLDKEVLMSFDLVDESGRSIPALDRRQNGAVATMMLVYAAVEVLGIEWSVPLELRARAVAETKEPSAERLMEYIDSHLAPHFANSAEYEQVKWLAIALDTKFALMADLPLDVLHRRMIIKTSFEIEEIATGHADAGQLRNTLAHVGVLDASMRLPTPEAAHCESYHFEFSAPAGLDIKGLAFEANGVKVHADEANSGSVGHLVTKLNEGTGVIGTDMPAHAAVFVLIPSLDGLLLAAVATGILSTGILFAAWNFVGRLAPHPSETAVALLLVLPGIITALLARPGEHVLASRLLRGVRGLTLIPGTALFIGAGALVIGNGDVTEVSTWWFWLGWAAATSTTLLIWMAIRSWWQARTRRNGVPKWARAVRKRVDQYMAWRRRQRADWEASQASGRVRECRP